MLRFRSAATTLALTAGLAVGGLAIGTTFASSSTGDTTSVVSRTDQQPERPDIEARLQDALAPLVKDGTLTQDQADKVAQTLAAQAPEKDHKRHHGGPGIKIVLDQLSVTGQELHDQLASGKSIADVAKDNSIDPQDVIDALVADAKAHIDQELASGELSSDQAATKISKVEARATEMVNTPGLPTREERHDHGPGSSPDQLPAAPAQPGS